MIPTMAAAAMLNIVNTAFIVVFEFIFMIKISLLLYVQIVHGGFTPEFAAPCDAWCSAPCSEM